MRMQAVDLLGAAGTADAELERRAAVRLRLVRDEPPPELPLLGRCTHEAGCQIGVFARGPTPSLDSACRFEPRKCRNQPGAGQVEGRRERLTATVVRVLLSYRGKAERTPARNPPERARRAPQLPLDDRAVIDPRHGERC